MISNIQTYTYNENWHLQGQNILDTILSHFYGLKQISYTSPQVQKSIRKWLQERNIPSFKRL